MCTNPIGFRDKNKSFLYYKRAVVSRIKSWEKRIKANRENINLTGGEPTIHPEFIKLVREIRRMFPGNKIVMATNGRMFSYPWFAKACLALNNLSLEIAVHSFDQKAHDRITGDKGSFQQTVKGIHNILKFLKASQELEIRIVITRLNYKDLDKTVAFLKKEFPGMDRLVFIFMEMEGLAKKNFKLVGLTHKELKPLLSLNRVKKWEKGLSEIRFYHFPLCVLPPELWKYTWRTLRKEEVAFLKRCGKCLYKKHCLGIHRDYLKLVGDKEFQPIKIKLDLRFQDFYYKPIVGLRKCSKRK